MPPDSPRGLWAQPTAQALPLQISLLHHCLLEDYRLQILSKVVSNWDALSIEEPGELASLNNFFCGMHIL